MGRQPATRSVKTPLSRDDNGARALFPRDYDNAEGGGTAFGEDGKAPDIITVPVIIISTNLLHPLCAAHHRL